MTIFEPRQAGLFERLPSDVDVALLTPGPSLLYLTGYDFNRTAWGQDSPFLYVLTRDLDGAVVLPELEMERAEPALDAEFYPYGEDGDDPIDAVERVTTDYGVDVPLAVEYRTMRLQEYILLDSIADLADTADLGAAVADLRSRKDGQELKLFRRACELTDEVLGETLQDVKPGMQEQTIDGMLRTRALQSDADAYGSGVVTSGPRTAINYTETTDRRIGQDDVVLIDTGIVFAGYYTDVTRTVAVGDPDGPFEEMHAVVRRAARQAREAAKPGMTAHELDAVARDVIEEAGYGEEFVHGLGHGIGLDSHEAPVLERGNDTVLEAGNVITIEPGIYRQGVGGIRIEDDVAITENGAEVLTSLGRSFDGV
ncbi:M24 family metallopeptidase [Saliphagus sp. GCM10025334]